MATSSKAKKKTVRIASGRKTRPPGRQAQRREHRAAPSSAPSSRTSRRPSSPATSPRPPSCSRPPRASSTPWPTRACSTRTRPLATRAACCQGQGARRLIQLPGGWKKNEGPALRAPATISLGPQVVVAGEVHDEVPGHGLHVTQRLADDHALHAVDDARHAIRRVADVGADAALAHARVEMAIAPASRSAQSLGRKVLPRGSRPDEDLAGMANCAHAGNARRPVLPSPPGVAQQEQCRGCNRAHEVPGIGASEATLLNLPSPRRWRTR